MKLLIHAIFLFFATTQAQASLVPSAPSKVKCAFVDDSGSHDLGSLVISWSTNYATPLDTGKFLVYVTELPNNQEAVRVRIMRGDHDYEIFQGNLSLPLTGAVFVDPTTGTKAELNCARPL